MDLKVELDDRERADLERIAAEQQRSVQEVALAALREYLDKDHRERVDEETRQCIDQYGDALRRLGEGPR